ncbi:MAG: VOC family protein, partial [Halobacteriales archaeon]|nr:VOC family protein [Halobacteriales archaeon]
FYHQCFGWKVNAIPGMGYTIFHTTPTDAKGMVSTPGNINGGMLKRQAPIDRLVITVQVADIDKAHQAVEKAGGKVLRGKQSVPGVGFTSYVKDPEGNTIGLMQPTR